MPEPFDTADPRRLLSDEQRADLIRQVESAIAPPADREPDSGEPDSGEPRAASREPQAAGRFGQGNLAKHRIPCLACGHDVDVPICFARALCDRCAQHFEPVHVGAIERAAALAAADAQARAHADAHAALGLLEKACTIRQSIIDDQVKAAQAREQVIAELGKLHIQSHAALACFRRTLAACASTAFVILGLTISVWLCWRLI